MHRSYEGTNSPIHMYWYDDRIEINSPGGPYGEVLAENFGQPGFVAYRNPQHYDHKYQSAIILYRREMEVAFWIQLGLWRIPVVPPSFHCDVAQTSGYLLYFRAPKTAKVYKHMVRVWMWIRNYCELPACAL